MIYDFEVVDYPMTYSFWSTDLKLIPFNNLEKKSSLNYGFFGQKKALSSLASTRDVLPFLVPFIIYVSVLIPATDQNISYFLSPSTKIIKIYHKKSKIQSLIGWFEVTWHVHILQTILSSHILSNISVYKFITLTLPLQPI